MNEVAKAELVTGGKVAPIIPRNVDEVARVANAVIVAGLAPNSYEGKTPEETRSKIIIGIMKGSEVGFPPITSLSTIAIINGRPCIYGDGAVALAQDGGKVEWIKEWFEGTENEDDWTAHCQMKRKGQDEPYSSKFSVSDAKRAHLWGNPKKRPWMEYPQRMLMWRAKGWCLRNGFADALCGLSIAEEVRDLPAAPEPVDTGFLDDEPRGPMIEHAPDTSTGGARDEAPAQKTAGKEDAAPEPSQTEDSPSEKYRVQTYRNIGECEDLENLGALEKATKPHLEALDKGVAARIENRFAVRRKELGKGNQAVEHNMPIVPEEVVEQHRRLTTGDFGKSKPMSRAQMAGMLCQQPEFQNWIAYNKKYGGWLESIAGSKTIPVTAEGAAIYVRRACDVISRAEFDTNPEAGEHWDKLYAEWQQSRTAEVR